MDEEDITPIQTDDDSLGSLSNPPSDVGSLSLSLEPEDIPDRSSEINITSQSKPEDIFNKLFGENNAENRSILPTLDADHPLMIKYQRNLKEHLLKLHLETDEQMRELNIALQDHVKEIDVIGKRNYELQSSVLNFKRAISSLTSTVEGITKKRKRLSEKVTTVQKNHKAVTEKCEVERKKEQELQEQIDQLALQIIQLSQLESESSADSSIVKQAAGKTAKQKSTLEIDKLRQDMLIARLEADKNNLCDKINLYKAQCGIKKEEVSDLRKTIVDASAEMENMHAEKVQLLQQWKASVDALGKHDTACSIINDNVRKYEDKLKDLDLELIDYKKLLRKEFEKNEQLTLKQLEINSDIKHITNVMADSEACQLKLEEEQAFVQKIIHSTDIELESLKKEEEKKIRKLMHKRQDLGRLLIAYRELEDKHVIVLNENLMQTSVTKQINNSIVLAREKIRDLEAKIELKEEENANIQLKILDAQIIIDKLEGDLAIADAKVKEQDRTVIQREAEIAKAHIIIQQKQNQLQIIEKKLAQVLAGVGGVELGPLEREIENYKRELTAINCKIKNLELEWLKYQRNLVTFTNDVGNNSHELETLRVKEAVLEETKVRINANIAKEEADIVELKRNIQQFQRDITRITTLIYHEKEQEERLENDTKILKEDFFNFLKDAELEFLRKENQAECLKNERKKIIMESMKLKQSCIIWEARMHLAEEAKKALKSEEYSTEITALVNEVRRLKRKILHIKNDESRLLKLLEMAVIRHTRLYIRADIEQLKSEKSPSKSHFLGKVDRLKKSMKEDKKKLEECQHEIAAAQEQLTELDEDREKQKTKIEELTNEIKIAEETIEKKQREKRQNVIKLSFKYKKNKLLQLINDDKYVRAIRNEALREAEIKRLKDNLQALEDIAGNFITTYPNLKQNLTKVLDHIVVGLDM